MVMRWRDPIPTQDQSLIDQNTDAGKPQPYPLNPRGSYPEDVSDANPIGSIELGNADDQHRQVLKALTDSGNAARAILDAILQVGWEIIRVDAGLAAQSQHPKLRVQFLVISRATAGLATLGVGAGLYPFTVGAVPVKVPFPLVIERGVDITFTGDGTIYLVGPTE